jgi:hypothetical protein
MTAAAAPRPPTSRAEKIGNCLCPLCRSMARVSLSKTGMPVITCQACHTQIFARSSHSDLLVRSMLIKQQAADLPAAPGAAPAAPPAADPPAAPGAAPAAPRRPEREPAPAANPWNIW